MSRKTLYDIQVGDTVIFDHGNSTKETEMTVTKVTNKIITANGKKFWKHNGFVVGWSSIKRSKKQQERAQPPMIIAKD